MCAGATPSSLRTEHFAQHTGQILFASKQLTSEDLGFCRHLSGPEPHTEKTP
jgi:hypothetical protein